MTTDTRIALAAHQLAVRFGADKDVPKRFRGDSSSSASTTFQADSDIEQRFRDLKESWEQVIGTMLDRLDEDQAWRFINLSPKLEGSPERVTSNTDFQAFIDYLILRRDQEGCEPTEIGFLAALSDAFQRQIEEQ